MNWFYAKNGSQQGPLSTDEIKSRISMGEIGPDDLAWCEGMSDWLPVAQIPQLKIEAPVREDVPPPVSAAAPSPYQAPAAPAASPYPAQMIPGQKPAQGLAIASMVCGIIAFIFCCTGVLAAILAIGAVVMGHIAISKVKQNPAVNGGKGMARTGLVLGYLGLVLSIIIVALNLWVATMSPQEVEDNFINLFPQEMRQQIRDQMDAERAKREAP
ncbi:GYF domain-containing protein [Luteolibacter flavescens]|uniref:GYF domain-containing protein n=1 Tax=Luteolibacter flavescens TaxID=1859460 RepID=A0ABT3FL47_9BACT|nr:GYF domain-containing protein [Luteolibacter flavescens]MCW1883720.1 GYF domain-containing protein [Luteolibacter flavescens]